MNLAQIEKISKALADETRLKIYEYIASHEGVNCCALVDMRGVTPATVSHHLKVLSEAGLIECKRKGQFVRNTVNEEVLEEFTKSVGALAQKRKK
ncbi:MAG TPA: metalloregulator ArsR/SmtB family transcription factor [Candidatus Sulfotelmatobacter sp.]|jgi:ArsR family transcriptional regulator|nr:metalloregulator ArsR/SmtB family transcription factor [Candidatus Sulfotelmatobacter sp.]